MLDIEIYLDVLEFIHATAGGEGVKILFRILSGHSEGSELSVNAQIPHPLIAACVVVYNQGELHEYSKDFTIFPPHNLNPNCQFFSCKFMFFRNRGVTKSIFPIRIDKTKEIGAAAFI